MAEVFDYELFEIGGRPLTRPVPTSILNHSTIAITGIGNYAIKNQSVLTTG